MSVSVPAPGTELIPNVSACRMWSNASCLLAACAVSRREPAADFLGCPSHRAPGACSCRPNIRQQLLPTTQHPPFRPLVREAPGVP